MPQFEGKTLILPAVSIGSVPQLTLDLLIHAPALACRRVGYLDGSECVPFVSPPEPTSPSWDIYTALDVFDSEHITILQQRSPVLKALRSVFVDRLMQWIRDAHFANVLILSSMDAAMRMGNEFATPILHIRPLMADTTDLSDAIARALPAFKPATYQGEGIPPLPGSGMTRMCLEHAPACTTAILMFCAEGDNRMDAHILARLVSDVCQLGLCTYGEMCGTSD